MSALLSLALLASLAFQAPEPPAAIPTPEQYFGFKIGDDGKLVTYIKGQEYLRELEKRSKWIRIEDIGRTTLGLPHGMAAISTPQNLENAARWKEVAAAILDPRRMDTNEAAALAKEGKAIVMITCGIHSDEVASPQMALELAHDLVTNTNLTFDREKVFENVILLIIPAVNPDGQEMIAEWVAATAGTPDEGAPMPKLYHYIAGHDDNRDWFAFNLKETRNISNVLYKTWRPHVLVDHHQMGSRGARFFVPPYGDPLNRAVHPLAWRGASLFGQAIAYELESAGKTGVAHDCYYQGWWQGGLSRAPWWHHGIGILTEAASANLAFPIDLDPGEMEASGGISTMADPTSRQPSPWRAGRWRVRDICDYQRIATFATLKLASERKDEILLNTYRMADAALAKGFEGGDVICYVLPAKQHDPGARDRLVEMLQLGGAEAFVIDEPWRAGGHIYDKGSVVIPLAQPFGPYIDDLLQDQRYPDFASAQRPYDITGWTLWRMMGVACERVAAPVESVLLGKAKWAGAHRSTLQFGAGGARFLAIAPGSNDSFRAAQRVIAEQKPLRRSSSALVTEDGRAVAPGAFLVEANDIPKDGGWLTADLSIDAAAVAEPPEASVVRVGGPKIGIFESYDPSMDKGWTYYLIDKYIWHPQLVPHPELERVLPLVDVFIVPESSPESLWDGGSKSDVKSSRVPFPKQYRGGIGAEGVKQLRQFIERGGTLVALGQSCDFLIERMDLPVTNILKGAKREEFSCPGSLLRCEVASPSPLAYGMDREFAGFFGSNVAFKTTPSNSKYKRNVIARFPADGNLLLSGYLKGEEKLRGAAGAVEIEMGRGRIILFGLRVQHRAQTDATFKLLFNAVLGAATSKE